MEDESLIAQRLVYDFVKLCDKDLFEYTISAELRKSCKLSHQRWVQHLEQQKIEQDKSAQSCKGKISLQELEVVKKEKLSHRGHYYVAEDHYYVTEDHYYVTEDHYYKGNTSV